MKNKVIKTSNKENSVIVSYENAKGERKRTIIPIRWFFAVRKIDEARVKELLSKTKYKYAIEDDPKFPNFIKIYCHDSYGDFTQSRSEVVMYLEDLGIETYEGDLLNDKRWYIDKDIDVSQNLKKLYFDIETDDSKGAIVIGRDRILSFAAIDDKGKKYFSVIEELNDNAEKELLSKFLEIIKDYDIILGWNSKGFDVPYLKARMRKCGLRYEREYKNWYNVAHYDLLARMRHAYRFDSQLRTFNLNYISNHFLGHGKVKHEGQKIIDMYHNDKKLLKKYNMEDCILVKEIDEKLGVSDMMIKQSSWCGVPPAHFGLYSIIDAYILKTAHGVGMFGKTSVRALEERDIDNVRGNENPDDVEDEGAQYMGAVVLDPIVGLYEKVYTFDYKSLYPSMMRTSNIGYDSILYEPKEGCIINPGTQNHLRKTGIVKPTFFTKKPSVINLAITELLKRRTDYKNLKLKMIEEGTNRGPAWDKVSSDEIVVKELSNSTYGIMGLKYGRYFSVDVAESITLFGQWCIAFARDHFNSRGYQVIYGDTDSVFVNTNGKILDIGTELEIFHTRLREELKTTYNIDDCHIQLNFDKEYDGLILVAKKSYVGRVVNQEGKKTNMLYGRGLDFIKKNTFGFAKDKQIELIELLLKNKLDIDDIKTWMFNVKEEFMTKEFSVDELTLINKIGKGLHDYAGTPPPHIRIAKELEKKIGHIQKGTEIEFIIVENIEGSLIEGILASDYKGGYDKNYYWENRTLPVLYRIVQAVYGGTTWEGLESRKKRGKVKKNIEQLSLF